MDAGQLCFLQAVCAGAVTGATGAITAGIGGFVAARTGAGVYTLTLGGAGVPAGECVIAVTMRTSGTYNYIHTSNTVKTVNTFAVDGTTATDKNFDFVVYALPPQ